VTLQRYGTTVARIVAFDRWQHRVALDVPPSSPTMAALSFTGMVLRPAGGLDVIGMLAMFPAAKAYCECSELFACAVLWIVPSVRGFRHLLRALLTDRHCGWVGGLFRDSE
jgi:hypothetical protein